MSNDPSPAFVKNGETVIEWKQEPNVRNQVSDTGGSPLRMSFSQTTCFIATFPSSQTEHPSYVS